MNFVFQPEAETEFNQAIDYYEAISPALGYDFAQEIHQTIQRITHFPNAWPVVKGQIRRSLVKRFPYGILYTEYQGQLLIIAVMNLHRKPDYWLNRIKLD